MATKREILKWLEDNADERGIAHWNKRKSTLSSYGIGLTRLRAYAKQIGRSPALSMELWTCDVYDAKVIAVLIDDPKKMTREHVENRVDNGLEDGLLVHVFTTCGAPLASTPFAFELAKEWIDHDDEIRRRCGYALLYELSKKNPKGMDDAFLLKRIAHIEATIHEEPMWVREAMNTALFGIGKRNRRLNEATILAVRAIGPVDIDYGDDNSCEPVDVLKHLTSPALQKKLNQYP